MSTAATARRTTPQAPGPSGAAGTAGPAPGALARSLALSRWILRELAPLQLVVQGVGIAVVSLTLLLERTGLFPALLAWAGVPEAAQGDLTIAGFTPVAVWIGLLGSMAHGAVMGARTPSLLTSGTTRATLGAAHLQTAVLLGLGLTGLVAPLALADLATSHVPSTQTFLVPLPWGFLAALPAGFLGYLTGAWGALTCLRHHWLLAVAELLVAVNITATLVYGAVTQWATPWGSIQLCLAAVLLVVCGPVGTVVLLRGYQPR